VNSDAHVLALRGFARIDQTMTPEDFRYRGGRWNVGKAHVLQPSGDLAPTPAVRLTQGDHGLGDLIR
jgi:hypothetical protein